MKKWCFIFMACMLAGCGSVERVVCLHDTIDKSAVLREYVYQKDSIYTDRWHTVERVGDTVWRRDSVVMARWHVSIDTVRDSVMVEVVREVPVEVVKERKVRGWWWWIGLCGIVAAAVSVWVWWKRR